MSLPPKSSIEGKDLIVEAQKLFVCRSELKKLWRKITSGALEIIPSFDNITLPDGTHNPFMRQVSLTGDVAQSPDELYSTATVAYPIFLDCLRDMLLELGIPPGRLDVYTMKKRARAMEKAADDYADRALGPALSWLSDIVRSSLVCENEDEVLRIVKYLMDLEAKEARGEVNLANPRFKLVRLKNRFEKPTPSGFRDFNMNLVLVLPAVDSDGEEGHPVLEHVCELQVHLRELKDFGNKIGSHAVYEFFRKYFKGNTASVEKRMQVLERLLGKKADEEDDKEEDGRDRDDIDAGGGGKGFEGRIILSLDDIVDNVIAERDEERLSAAFDLFDMMAEFNAAARILKAQIALQDPEDVRDLLRMEGKLAGLLHEQGEWDEAKKLFTSVLAKQTKLLGAEHASTLLTEGNLAELLMQEGDLDDAKAKMQRVLEAQTKLLGPNHPHTRYTAGNLMEVMEKIANK